MTCAEAYDFWLFLEPMFAVVGVAAMVAVVVTTIALPVICRSPNDIPPPPPPPPASGGAVQ